MRAVQGQKFLCRSTDGTNLWPKHMLNTNHLNACFVRYERRMSTPSRQAHSAEAACRRPTAANALASMLANNTLHKQIRAIAPAALQIALQCATGMPWVTPLIVTTKRFKIPPHLFIFTHLSICRWCQPVVVKCAPRVCKPTSMLSLLQG